MKGQDKLEGGEGGGGSKIKLHLQEWEVNRQTSKTQKLKNKNKFTI